MVPRVFRGGGNAVRAMIRIPVSAAEATVPVIARHVLHLLIALSLIAGTASVARAQSDDHAHHGSDGAADCVSCPKPRESSGTSWQPDAAGSAHAHRRLGAWLVGTHLEFTPMAMKETGPRGGSAFVVPNHGMLNLRRAAGDGTFGIRTMMSLEPLMGAEGYPLLLQAGETADGINPLIDRQHPHDLFMELAATYERRLPSGALVSFYLAAVGEPALGPPAFMHRPSASLLPTSPITHHWIDSTHITQGVFTVGLAPSERLRFELSAFNGREPDEKRWGLVAPGFDSFSLRVSLNPTAALALQASGGVVKDPEFVHPEADITKLSASVMYAKRWDDGGLDALVAVAHSTRTASLYPVAGGFYYTPGATSPALIVENTIRLRRLHEFVVRAEAVRKGELFGLDDPRHTSQFPVARATLGYALRVVDRHNAIVRIGAAWSAVRVSEGIRADYGGNQMGILGFVRIGAH